jgi:serine phosphatase RsbU (regulator of sigma subunit)
MNTQFLKTCKTALFAIAAAAALVLFSAFNEPLIAQFSSQVQQLSIDDMSADEKLIYLSDVWLFKAGDNENWSSASNSDSTWQQVSTYLGPSELSFLDWNGIGWFRLPIKVDSSLVNYPLALIVQQHNGASEIYLDGQKISQIGQVSATQSGYRAERSFRPVPVVISDTTEHILSVRYANYEASYFNSFSALGFTSGFRFLLGDLNYYSLKAAQGQKSATSELPVFFIGSLLAFTVIHLLLFLFYPAGKRNLYFALFTGMLLLLIYTFYVNNVTGSPLKALFYYRFSLICWLITMVLALRFTYSLLYKKVPLQFWVFLGGALLLSALSWFQGTEPVFLREGFVLVILLEILRVLIFSVFRKKHGIWIVAVGVLFFVAGIFYKMLIDLNLMTGEPVAGSIYGSSALIFAMSIYLSRDFAKTNRRLEQKLREVKHLSERSLAQERINREKEVERRLLKAENERKSGELEEARKLQLSMLPKKMPATDCWEIAVFMETAQEVGGDYYDFSDSESDGLTIALGDATGHGMKAGIMVAAVKSYFHTLADGHDLLQILEQISAGIHNMDLKMMFMGFQILKCRNNSVSIASAGMPPALWYKKEDRRVQELLLKGLPLGTRVRYPYRTIDFSVQAGDVLVLMSDGLPELFNGDRRQLGQERVRQTLLETGDYSASDILSKLTMLIDQWSGDKEQEDDITIMVMKAK